GLFPLRDVDLYRFDGTADRKRVVEGESATGGVTFTRELRLFDGNGVPLYLAGFNTNTSLEYQLPADGAYYLGVSGFGNRSYDPTSAGGPGTAVGTRGDYRLDLTLATPVADAAGQTLSTAAVTGLAGDGTYSATAKIGDGLFPLRDVDLYRFDGT